MASLQINSKLKVDLNDVLVGISKLEIAELESFMSQVSKLLARKKAPSLSQKETQLLLEINKGLPEKTQSRYNVLSSKLTEENITMGEHQELLEIITTIEKMDVKRLEYLIELAQLREMELDDLMEELGLSHKGYV